jgi:predicted RNA-binding protein with PIN domain
MKTPAPTQPRTVEGMAIEYALGNEDSCHRVDFTAGYQKALSYFERMIESTRENDSAKLSVIHTRIAELNMVYDRGRESLRRELTEKLRALK